MSDEPTLYAREADAAWTNYYTLHRILKQCGMQIVAELEPTTGLQANPGAEKLLDVLIDLFVSEHDKVEEMAGQRDRAHTAELARDALTPPDAPPKPTTTLDAIVFGEGENGVREWLKTVNPNELRLALAEENDEDRTLWAQEMLAAARIDGATHAIILALESYLPSNADDGTMAANAAEGE